MTIIIQKGQTNSSQEYGIWELFDETISTINYKSYVTYIW